MTTKQANLLALGVVTGHTFPETTKEAGVGRGLLSIIRSLGHDAGTVNKAVRGAGAAGAAAAKNIGAAGVNLARDVGHRAGVAAAPITGKVKDLARAGLEHGAGVRGRTGAEAIANGTLAKATVGRGINAVEHAAHSANEAAGGFLERNKKLIGRSGVGVGAAAGLNYLTGNPLGGAMDATGSAAGNGWQWLKDNGYQGILDGVGGAYNDTTSGVAKAYEDVSDGISNAYNGAVNGVVDAYDTASNWHPYDAAVNATADGMEYAAALPGRMYNGATDYMADAYNAAGDAATKLRYGNRGPR